LNFKNKIIFYLLPFLLSGCGILYTNVHVPRAYRSATPGDVEASQNDPIVTGKSCTHSLLFLFAWGNGGYAAATKNALKNYPDGILYDVQSDSQLKSVLGLYTRLYTVVTGKVAKRK